jgi:hypothetical protein
MAHNGVPHEAFVKLLEEGLKNEIEPLTQWDGKDALVHLAKAVENAGGMVGSRMGRCATLSARARGFIRDDDKEHVMDPDLEDGSVSLIERGLGGAPTMLFESARELLQAGFSPMKHPLLCEKMIWVIKTTIQSYIEKYHISLPLSVEMFVIPGKFANHGVTADF